MEDDHVDRLDVQARQRVELTSTNRSIELDRSHDPCPETPAAEAARAPDHRTPGPESLLAEPACASRLAGLVVEAEDVPPDPISNSAVKASSAHGTVPQGTGESVTARPAKRAAPASLVTLTQAGSPQDPGAATPERARRGVEQPGSSSGS